MTVADVAGAILVAVVATLCFSLLAFQAFTGVPSVSATASEAADVAALLREAGIGAQGTIYDLGCGWGKLVAALAEAFPQARVVGIEISPFPYWAARFRTRKFPNVILRRGNFFDCDLRDAQAVTSYLMAKPTQKLASFLDAKLKEGTPVVALSFWFRDREVSATREGLGFRGAAALYYWPARKSN